MTVVTSKKRQIIVNTYKNGGMKGYLLTVQNTTNTYNSNKHQTYYNNIPHFPYNQNNS